MDFNEEEQQYNKNVVEQKTNKHNNEICTRISHPRLWIVLQYSASQRCEMATFFVCFSTTAILEKFSFFGKMSAY